MTLSYFDMLSGKPIYYKGVGHLKSPKLRELLSSENMNQQIYNLYLNFLAWDKEKLVSYIQSLGAKIPPKIQSEALTTFDVATLFLDIRDIYQKIFSFFIVEEPVWENKQFVIYNSENQPCGSIKRDNFESIRKCLLNLNYISLEEDNIPENYTSEHAKQTWEKIQGYLKEQAKNPREDKKYMHLCNIISKVSVAHASYNLLNIYDLTIFQLYDAFFQIGYLRSCDLSERIFSQHGGDDFKFDKWLDPILKNI